jgi:hypothetical protein
MHNLNLTVHRDSNIDEVSLAVGHSSTVRITLSQRDLRRELIKHGQSYYTQRV